eukprot:INCI12220.1.p1 GENE.INCI12220.1~~INCI12220.1.p1  ORF type:complete len:115 (+),score=3.31 INCI12220.1:49-393(+)
MWSGGVAILLCNRCACVARLYQRIGLIRKLSQVPVVLFPVNFGAGSGPGAPTHSIALRTFITRDFMTGVPAIPGADIPEAVLVSMVDQILREVPGVARVCYDLTSKPPATTEWE